MQQEPTESENNLKEWKTKTGPKMNKKFLAWAWLAKTNKYIPDSEVADSSKCPSHPTPPHPSSYTHADVCSNRLFNLVDMELKFP